MRDKPVGGKTKNPGSPLAAYQRHKRATTYGPTGGAQPRPTRGAGGSRPKPNPGSPTAAAERQKRATTYGPTGGAQPRPTRGGGSMAGDKKKAAARAAGSPLAAYERNKRATTYGPTGGSQPKANPGSPNDAAARSRSKPKTDAQLIAEQRALRAKLKGVDYAALGRYMEAKGYKGKGWNNKPFK